MKCRFSHAQGSQKCFFSPIYLARIPMIALLLGLLAARLSTFGASISYGNFGPVGGVSFNDVSESSTTDSVPLYGPPELFPTGLDFDPVSFVVTTAGGGSDSTKGQLTLSIQTAPGTGVTSISTLENGDLSLLGSGGAGTSVSFENILNIRVTELDGVPVAPFDLVPVTASTSYLLPPAKFNELWSLGLTADVAGHIPAGHLATGLEITIENNLSATSESQSVSFGAKKDFRITVGTGEQVPEGGKTLWLLIGAATLLAMKRGGLRLHQNVRNVYNSR